MKTKNYLSLLIGMFFLFGAVLNAQTEKEVEKRIIKKIVKKNDLNFDGNKLIVNLSTNDNSDNSAPYMGVYMNDLTFKKAYELHYNKNYGVYFSSVVAGSPASKSGLRGGDIIMTFDGEKVYSESKLTSILHAKKIGDKVPVKIFRNEKEEDIILTLGKRNESKDEDEEGNAQNKKSRKTVGYGGGSWIPTWFVPDFSELNTIASNLGFSSETFPEKGIYLSGGGGKGPIGRRFFMGGMGASHKNTKTTKHLWAIDESGLDTVSVSRKMTYAVSFGGVTLDRRIPITNKLTSSLGCMLGGGSVSMKVSQSYNTVTNIDLDNGLDDNFDDNYLRKTSLSLKNNFLVFQPKIMMMYHFTSWLGIRAEAGYMLSYSPKDWEVSRNDSSVAAENLPTSNMDGLTLSVGPWFGF